MYKMFLEITSCLYKNAADEKTLLQFNFNNICLLFFHKLNSADLYGRERRRPY